MNRTFSKILVLVVLQLFFISFFISCDKSPKTDLKWHGFEKAIKLAAKEDKPIMLDFFADWCGWCYELDKKVFNDPEVKEYLKENFILSRLNADSRFKSIKYKGQLVSPYDLFMMTGSSSLPTVVFFDSDANFVHSQPGFHPKEFYFKLLNDVKDSIDKVKSIQR